MNRFTKSLRFKLTLLVIAVELFIFTGAGVFYTRLFSQEIDGAIIARLSIPGFLMTRGELNFDAVSDKRTMEGLLREPYSEGMVIGLDGHVYFSSNPARQDTRLDAIDGLKLPDPESSAFSADAPDLIAPVEDSTGVYLTCLSPLRPNGKLTGYLYLKVGTGVSEAEKRNIAILFAAGSLGTIFLTASILSLLLHLMVTSRLNNLVEVFRRFALGDYAARAQPIGGNDEIATLMNGFNGLAKRLEDTMVHLSESESRFRVLVEHAPEAILVYDADTKHYVEANHNAERLFACSLEQLRLSNPADFFAAVQPAPITVEQSVGKALAGEEVVVERAITNARGQQLLCEVRLVLLPASNRRLIRASYIDITERRRAEDDLRLMNERFALATTAGHMGVWDWYIESDRLVWDDGMYRLYGIRREDFAGAYDAWLQGVHPDDRANAHEAITLAKSGVREYDVEFRVVWPSGDIHYIKAYAQTVRDAQGNPLRMTGVNFDITGRRLAEEELRRLTLFQRTILNSAAYSIVSAAPDGIITAFNPAAERLLGYSADEVVGKQSPALWHDPLEVERYALLLSEELGEKIQPGFDVFTARPKRNLPEEHEWTFVRKDGTRVPVNLSVTALRGEDGSTTGFVGMIYDLTERKRAEEELRRYKDQLEETVQQRTAELVLARDAAEAANAAKSVFLANMSHELRTPMNAILGFSAIMRREPQLTESQRESLGIINRSGEHLLTLIDDVLEIAKIEAGRIQLENAPFDLGAMVRDVADMMRLRAQEKGLQLLLDQSSAFPRYIKGDEARLRQVLVNLVGNAVKFTQHGGVTIRLGVKHNARDHLLIEVEDTGPGIAREDQQRVFQPFVQLGGAGTQKGTGLGLTISHQYVQLMGGTMGVESTVGKGSIFRVELPAELAEEAGTGTLVSEGQAEEVIGLAPGQPACRILIAEDQPENRMLLVKLMTSIGVDVKLAENGAECVRLFQEWHPHLIWMDRRMPVMDGVEAARRIRALPDGQDVKIVAVTASVFKEQRQELLDAGMNDFVRKPYRFHEIYGCMAKQLGVKYIYRDSVPMAGEAPPIAVTPAMLAALPGAERKELKDAVESLDGVRISAAIQRICEADAELGRALSLLAENFDYPAILSALTAETQQREAPGGSGT